MRHLGDDGVVQWVTAAKPGGRGLDDTRPSMTPSSLRNPRWGMATGRQPPCRDHHAGGRAPSGDGGSANVRRGRSRDLHVGAAGTLAGITSGTPYDPGWGWPKPRCWSALALRATG